MKVAVGCDHGGLEHKNAVISHLRKRGFEVENFGVNDEKSVDYPDIALPLAKAVSEGKYDFGILICGTGIGMSLAANKVKGIRAAACSEHFSAKYTRLHNNSNILCIGGRVIGIGTAIELVDLFVDTPFEGGRHQNRIDKITKIENTDI